jgi:UDP-glucose 4-epimerase
MPRWAGDPPALFADPRKAAQGRRFTATRSGIDNIVRTASDFMQRSKRT